MTDVPHTSLDSYKNNRNKFCGSWSVAGKIEKDGKQYGHVGRLGCKRWSCERCGPKRAWALRRAIIKKAEEYKLQRLLTLTLDPRTCSAEDSTKYIQDTWSKMRTYLKRKYGQPINYISRPELQKSGYAHLHVLVDRFIPHSWIKASWSRLGGGRIVDIRYVDIHRIAPYLSKYLTKEAILSQFPPGMRRFTTSRSIKLFEKAVKSAWTLIKNSIDNLRPPVGMPISELFCDNDGEMQWFRFEIPATN